jgi:glutamine amidotransferase
MKNEMKIIVIDYGSGNLKSAAKAFQRAADEAGYEAEVTVSADAASLSGATHIVLPGQGAFADCMKGLKAVPGMVVALEECVMKRKVPFFGICVGMQLLAERGLEHGTHEGLGWIKGEIVRLEPSDKSLKIPHMGWNELQVKAPSHPFMSGVKNGDHVYFVHSYHMRVDEPDTLIATADYGGPVTAALAKGNLWGTQFHPEKSQETGLRLIRNFLGTVA